MEMNDLNKRLNEITERKEFDLFPNMPTKNLLIEVTNTCNSNCIFCANSKMKRTRKKIDKGFVTRILNEAYDLGIREVGFYTTGESLLVDELKDYIKYAKIIGYNYTYLTTNGILLNENKIQELIDSGIDSIKLSINAINKEDYRFIHGVDYYDQVINNLYILYNYRERNKLSFKIYVSYIATRYTDYDISKIKSHFEAFCDSVAIVNVRNQSGLMPEIKDYLTCEDVDNKIQADRMIPCHYVFETINISCEGYLTACCTDFENYLAYADLNKTSLKDAWNNNLITELRKKHLENNLDGTLCDNCINHIRKAPTPLSSEFIESENISDILENDKVIKRLELYKKGGIKNGISRCL